MIIQKNNKSFRNKEICHGSDIEFLNSYFEMNGNFPLFRQVLIETRTDCNNHCPFCPHAHYKKALNIMTWECYCKIIDSLAEIEYNGRIALMISNEPLLEKRLIEIIHYAKSISQGFFLDITTNGKLLTKDKVDDLFISGLDNITINDYRSDRAQYPNKLSNNLEEVKKAYGNNPKVNIIKRRTDEQWTNYAGIIKQTFSLEEYGFCNFPFRKLIFAYNGDVLLCCNDFSYKTSFGNIFKDSIMDCWYNEEYNRIRFALLKNERIGLCSQCNDSQDYNIY
jgi:MoaA/NifB/PqqE/SkfB family radical SAM enzyme